MTAYEKIILLTQAQKQLEENLKVLKIALEAIEVLSDLQDMWGEKEIKTTEQSIRNTTTILGVLTEENTECTDKIKRVYLKNTYHYIID